MDLKHFDSPILLNVDAGDIFITSGATHALHIIACLLSGCRNKIAAQDPCNVGILRTFLNAGCEIEPIPVDEKGLRAECLDGVSAGAVYTTPSHQFPLGPILPAGRRAELIRYARENGIYLIEDDYDVCCRPVPPGRTKRTRVVFFPGCFFPGGNVGTVQDNFPFTIWPALPSWPQGLWTVCSRSSWPACSFNLS